MLVDVLSLRPIVRPFRRLVPIALFLTVVCGLALPSAVYGQAAAPPVPDPRSLALSKKILPRGATLTNERSGNLAADNASGLHGATFRALGRTGGVIQTARWTATVQHHKRTIVMRYIASIFPTEDDAQDAYVDARAALWENGQPAQLTGISTPVFSVRERSDDTTTHAVISRGQVELELKVRYPHAAGKTAKGTALSTLARASLQAAHKAESLVAASAPKSAGSDLPPITVAPQGTGPVIESPSLLAMDASTAPPGSILLPGSARTGKPAVASVVAPHLLVAPAGGISRYARVATAGADEIYHSVALYTSAADATASYGALIAANQALHPASVSLAPWMVNLPRLGVSDAAAAWQTPGEGILAFRWGNVVEVVADSGPQPLALALLAERLAERIPSALSARGTDVVDAAGALVHLVGLNWYGAEEGDFVVGGLDYAPYQSILQSILRAGYNSIRIPFSNQMVESNPIVTAHVAANPELSGLHALDILDRIIQYAGALGIGVILDNHRSEAGWSSQPSGLWYTADYPDAAWVSDWSLLATRYAASTAVIGMDLRNEPHGPTTWGSGIAATDWHAAAQRAGNAVITADPHALVIVEGIQFYGSAPSYWWGGNLMGVATAPVILQHADGTPARDRLVYSAHDYGPNMCGSGCPWFNSTATYESLTQTWESYWGYITANPAASYAAPVWVGEFGTCNYNTSCVADSTPGSQGQWFSYLVRYIGAKHLGWSYWSANGTQSTGGTRIYGALDWYGYFTRDWSGAGPVLVAALRPIQSDSVPQASSGP